ncbi:unnamed protein product [Brachionus calyciflorus]|uniref:Uncharacterized protein n=1 Tax=Brachionus calyciflorus TaxID=104777 RepID=A0A813S431_9BILA|nr:unnamed protein product [Brachionus calyciflorus]
MSSGRTSDFYRTKNLPERFDNPDIMKGYSEKMINPLYKTSNMEYGGKRPNVHTMPVQYHSKSSGFTEHLGKTGMYRNHSLNTAATRSKV